MKIERGNESNLRYDKRMVPANADATDSSMPLKYRGIEREYDGRTCAVREHAEFTIMTNEIQLKVTQIGFLELGILFWAKQLRNSINEKQKQRRKKFRRQNFQLKPERNQQNENFSSTIFCRVIIYVRVHTVVPSMLLSSDLGLIGN